jgi:hypothetical protein
MQRTYRPVLDGVRTQVTKPATDDGKRAAGFVDLTPTWSGILPLFITALTEGNAAAQATARLELARMADLADKYNALSKAKRTKAGGNLPFAHD